MKKLSLILLSTAFVAVGFAQENQETSKVEQNKTEVKIEAKETQKPASLKSYVLNKKVTISTEDQKKLMLGTKNMEAQPASNGKEIKSSEIKKETGTIE